MSKIYGIIGGVALALLIIGALTLQKKELEKEVLKQKNKIEHLENELSNSKKALKQEKKSFAAMKNARENCQKALESKEGDYQSLYKALEKKERQRDSLNKALSKERAKICEQGEITCPEYEDLRESLNKIRKEWNR